MDGAPKNPLKDLRAYRESLSENQSQFWGRFGVTQSGGSRYENGRALPIPVSILIAAFAHEFIDDEMLGKLQKYVS